MAPNKVQTNKVIWEMKQQGNSSMMGQENDETTECVCNLETVYFFNIISESRLLV